MQPIKGDISKLTSNYNAKRAAANMEIADELSKLAFKYESDRCPQIKHPFTPVYYNLLKDKQKTIKKVLEIGIGFREMDSWRSYRTGAGLYMWQDFFPNAEIYGADIDPRAIIQTTRIKTFLCNQTKKEDLIDLIKHTGTDLDLIIDDGSHIATDQIFTCNTTMPLINENVIYIIEDVREPETVASALKLYDCKIPNLRRRFQDDNLVIVTKRKSSNLI